MSLPRTEGFNVNDDFVLRMKNITKTFPGVVALNDVSFNLKKGEIHALVGENGAGKSTLMKILGGVYTPDKGEIEIKGKPVTITCPHDAMDNKVSVIYQEFNLVPALSIAENLFLGKEIVKGTLKNLDKEEMIKQAENVMARLGIENIDCSQEVRNLSVAVQQLVEVGKAIFNNNDILVMDEPTAVLTENETKTLFKLVKGLKEKGISVIYISHRLEEVIELSDRITILRDGEFVSTLDNSNKSVSKDEIVRLMVGRSLKDYFPEKEDVNYDDTVLEVKNLTSKGLFENISFSLKKGEILGFAGLVGAGRTEIMKALFGSIKTDEGEIFLEGKKVSINSPSEAKRLGIGFVPEDRKREGVVLKMNLGENICLPNHDKINKFGHIFISKKRKLVDKFIKGLSIRPPLPERLVRDFSGGNQQKAVIAKWLAINPKVMILDEPTRGIDVGAKVEIYSIINKLAKEGVGIIVISSELLELMGICDRVIVIHEGSISGEFKKGSYDQEKIMRAAAGL